MRILLEDRKGYGTFKRIERPDKRALKLARRAKQNRRNLQGAIT